MSVQKKEKAMWEKLPPHKDNIKTFRVLQSTGGVPVRYTASASFAWTRHSAHFDCLHLDVNSRNGSSWDPYSCRSKSHNFRPYA